MELLTWKVNAGQRAFSAKELLSNQADKMIYPLDGNQIPCPVSLVAGLVSLYKVAPVTWSPMEFMPRLNDMDISLLRLSYIQRWVPNLSTTGDNRSPQYDTISQGDRPARWLVDYIRLHKERDHTFPSGEYFMLWVGICFSCLQICQLCWLAEYLILFPRISY